MSALIFVNTEKSALHPLTYAPWGNNLKRTKKPILFEDWIEDIGPQKLAKKLHLDPMTINHWRAGRSDPRVVHMRKIKKISRGLISYEQMIDRDYETIRAASRRKPKDD